MSKDQTGPPRRVMLSASISSSRTRRPVSYQKRQRAETKARYAPLQYQLSPTTGFWGEEKKGSPFFFSIRSLRSLSPQND
ncbi:hypothetical protein CEXT_449571 [Caerostris extrusa]|uniref:Uncharacterized protein n=1 Tax=Caerostris extrusa TaxID=172846 RepID=A0AAV4WCT9_CAEEX|nr:hypothetical protein CEXT_449571 [Caerostris extrusa]